MALGVDDLLCDLHNIFIIVCLWGLCYVIPTAGPFGFVCGIKGWCRYVVDAKPSHLHLYGVSLSPSVWLSEWQWTLIFPD